MLQEPEKNKDDDFLNEFRQRLADQANARIEEKQKELQRSKSVFLGAVSGVVLACAVGWFALSPKSNKDENTDVPVIKKTAAATKVKPSEPGGMEILNQDKSVYNIIDSSIEANTKVEQLLPPPEEPKLPEITAENTQVAENENISSLVETVYNGEDTVIEEAPEPKAISEQPEQKTVSIAEVVNKAETTVRERDYTLPGEGPKVVEEVKTTEEKKATIETPKAPANSGSWQIQITSSQNKDAVRKSIAPTIKKHPELANLPNEIEEANVNGKMYYRLKFGSFAERSGADSICNKIKSVKGSCIVIKKK